MCYNRTTTPSVWQLGYSLLLSCALLLSGCQEDMLPSDEDRRDGSQSQVGNMVEDFSFTLSTGEQTALTTRLQTHDAVVLYFTMWCPVCTEHMQHIQQHFISAYPNVDFLFVDYLTDSVTNTRSTQLSQGWDGFDTISDFDNTLENLFDGTMAITVVIDKNSVVLLNEEFKNGARLEEALENL